MARPEGSYNTQTEVDASLLWSFVDVNHPTKVEIFEGLGFAGPKVGRLSKFLARETGRNIIIPPSRPDAATGRWEYHTSFDAGQSAQWVAWSLKHVAARAGWISEVSDRLAVQFPDEVLFQVIAATATALQVQANAARTGL